MSLLSLSQALLLGHRELEIEDQLIKLSDLKRAQIDAVGRLQDTKLSYKQGGEAYRFVKTAIEQLKATIQNLNSQETTLTVALNQVKRDKNRAEQMMQQDSRGA